MSYSPIELREMAEHLLDVARRLAPEAEGIDFLDEDFEIEELVQLRSHLSATRKAIDLVNKGLARYWLERYGRTPFETEYELWYVNQTKGKRVYDEPAFYAWLATKDADELSKLVPSYSIKLGGMSPAERATFIDETPTSNDVTIQSKPRR